MQALSSATSFVNQKVARSHFLRKLNEVVKWGLFTRKLPGYYRGKGEIGQVPYNPHHHLEDATSFLHVECLRENGGGTG